MWLFSYRSPFSHASRRAEVRRIPREVGCVERRGGSEKNVTPEQDSVSMKLYVGNLPYNTTEDDLR
ncbi:MAG TPA: hypothetical protein VIY96_09385, partial [Thermoanaerobaculia bacterium]